MSEPTKIRADELSPGDVVEKTIILVTKPVTYDISDEEREQTLAGFAEREAIVTDEQLADGWVVARFYSTSGFGKMVAPAAAPVEVTDSDADAPAILVREQRIKHAAKMLSELVAIGLDGDVTTTLLDYDGSAAEIKVDVKNDVPLVTVREIPAGETFFTQPEDVTSAVQDTLSEAARIREALTALITNRSSYDDDGPAGVLDSNDISDAELLAATREEPLS